MNEQKFKDVKTLSSFRKRYYDYETLHNRELYYDWQSQFIQEHLKRMERQEERTVIVTDGAYRGTKNRSVSFGHVYG